MSVPKIKLALQPIPKSLVRVSIAGEYLKNMGCPEAEIRSVQQAVAEGLVADLTVIGFNTANVAKERFTLRFDPLGRDDIIHLDLADGKSTIEALDTGFAGAVAYSVQLLKRRQLKPQFFITWSKEALSNRAHLRATCERLNIAMDVGPLPETQPDAFSPPSYAPPRTTPAPSASNVQWAEAAPPPPANSFFKQILSLRTAKDPGISYTIDKVVRRT